MAPLSLTPCSLEDALLPDMDPSDIADRIAIMRIQEETTYRVKDYIADSAVYRKRASKPVDRDCRVKMCEWCYQVVDFCKFRRETVGIGMSYLDRYLCTPKGKGALCNRKEYQLAAMTALYIAIKLHEPLEMETSLLADLSRGCYNEMEFVDMEQTILQAIKWRVNGPTPLAFVTHFMALLPSRVHPNVAESILDYARFQTELAVADQDFVNIRPSEIALASTLNAMEGMDLNLFPLKLQAKFIRNVERFSEMQVTDAEKTQSHLSLLLVGLLKTEFPDIIAGPIACESDDEQYVEDKYKPGALSRRHSPVSVIRHPRSGTNV
jgi:Cyclin, N-terminal domain/Cyclin, C-terminal domain